MTAAVAVVVVGVDDGWNEEEVDNDASGAGVLYLEME